MISRCNRKGCPQDGTLRPVLLLRAPKGPELRAVVGMMICENHRTMLPETYLDKLEVTRWPLLCAHYEDAWRGALRAKVTTLGPVRPPERLLTHVVYIAHDAPESVAYDEQLNQVRGGKAPEIPVYDAAGRGEAYKVPLIRGKS